MRLCAARARCPRGEKGAAPPSPQSVTALSAAAGGLPLSDRRTTRNVMDAAFGAPCRDTNPKTTTGPRKKWRTPPTQRESNHSEEPHLTLGYLHRRRPKFSTVGRCGGRSRRRRALPIEVVVPVCGSPCSRLCGFSPPPREAKPAQSRNVSDASEHTLRHEVVRDRKTSALAARQRGTCRKRLQDARREAAQTKRKE